MSPEGTIVPGELTFLFVLLIFLLSIRGQRRVYIQDSLADRVCGRKSAMTQHI